MWMHIITPVHYHPHIISFSLTHLSAEFNKSDVFAHWNSFTSAYNHVLDYHVHFYVYSFHFISIPSVYQAKKNETTTTTNPFLSHMSWWNYWINFFWLLIYIRLLIYSSWHWRGWIHLIFQESKMKMA